jgi:hypothetical protein
MKDLEDLRYSIAKLSVKLMIDEPASLKYQERPAEKPKLFQRTSFSIKWFPN